MEHSIEETQKQVSYWALEKLEGYSGLFSLFQQKPQHKLGFFVANPA
jgi:hypothetical protein